MKKIPTIFGAILFATFFLMSFGSNSSSNEKAEIIKEYKDSIALVEKAHQDSIVNSDFKDEKNKIFTTIKEKFTVDIPSPSGYGTGVCQVTFSLEVKRPADPKNLGEVVFKSFQNESYETFLKYIFTEADCDTMVKNADAPDSLKITVVKQMKGLTNYIRHNSKENFEMIISAGKQKGIVWKKAKLTDVTYDIESSDDIQSTDISLLCRYKSNVFQIKLDNCHKSDSWLMMDKAEIRFDE